MGGRERVSTGVRGGGAEIGFCTGGVGTVGVEGRGSGVVMRRRKGEVWWVAEISGQVAGRVWKSKEQNLKGEREALILEREALSAIVTTCLWFHYVKTPSNHAPGSTAVCGSKLLTNGIVIKETCPQLNDIIEDKISTLVM